MEKFFLLTAKFVVFFTTMSTLKQSKKELSQHEIAYNTCSMETTLSI